MIVKNCWTWIRGWAAEEIPGTTVAGLTPYQWVDFPWDTPVGCDGGGMGKMMPKEKATLPRPKMSPEWGWKTFLPFLHLWPSLSLYIQKTGVEGAKPRGHSQDRRTAQDHRSIKTDSKPSTIEEVCFHSGLQHYKKSAPTWTQNKVHYNRNLSCRQEECFHRRHRRMEEAGESLWNRLKHISREEEWEQQHIWSKSNKIICKIGNNKSPKYRKSSKTNREHV